MPVMHQRQARIVRHHHLLRRRAKHPRKQFSRFRQPLQSPVIPAIGPVFRQKFLFARQRKQSPAQFQLRRRRLAPRQVQLHSLNLQCRISLLQFLQPASHRRTLRSGSHHVVCPQLIFVSGMRSNSRAPLFHYRGFSLSVATPRHPPPQSHFGRRSPDFRISHFPFQISAAEIVCYTIPHSSHPTSSRRSPHEILRSLLPQAISRRWLSAHRALHSRRSAPSFGLRLCRSSRRKSAPAADAAGRCWLRRHLQNR